MKIYFSLKSIPEFQGLSQAESLKKYRVYYLKSFGHWGQWLGLGLTILFIWAGYWVAEVLFPVFFVFQLSGFVNFGMKMLFVVLAALIYQVFVLRVIAFLAKGDGGK